MNERTIIPGQHHAYYLGTEHDKESHQKFMRFFVDFPTGYNLFRYEDPMKGKEYEQMMLKSGVTPYGDNAPVSIWKIIYPEDMTTFDPSVCFCTLEVGYIPEYYDTDKNFPKWDLEHWIKVGEMPLLPGIDFKDDWSEVKADWDRIACPTKFDLERQQREMQDVANELELRGYHRPEDYLVKKSLKAEEIFADLYRNQRNDNVR